MSAVLILGAGDGIGGAVAERFAKGGYKTVLVRRDLEKAQAAADALVKKGYQAVARNEDIRDPEAMAALFNWVESQVGPIEVCVYNAGANIQKPLAETSPKLFRRVWELACFGGFLAAHECAKVMAPRKRGTIIFTGATSSIMGRTGYAAFASGKFALRGVAQATARELQPENIHVSHVVIDAPVESVGLRKMMAAQNVNMDEFAPDTLTTTESLADAYWNLHKQPRDAWTHELDIRPFSERW